VLAIIFVCLMILIALFVLLKGADYLVDGSADLARFLRVSPIVVGLTIMAFGTSLPEFIISFFSALNGQSDIAIGNIVGSNIANLALIVGIGAIVAKNIKVRSTSLMYEMPFLVVSSFLLLILADDFFIFGKDTLTLSRFDGMVLLLVFVIFMSYIFSSIKEQRKTVTKEFSIEFKNKNPLWKNILFVVGGLAALIAGGRIFTLYAGQLADLAGLSGSFIGLTIAALGTSLPELAATITALWKKQGDIALGNIVGSNIFNILFVLGITSMIRPITIDSIILSVDAIVMIFISLVFLVFATKDTNINWTEGTSLLMMYVIYIIFVFWRM